MRNITDVDDKINARAIELGISIQELTSKTYAEFQEDMSYLNCLSPTYEPKATEHIKDIISINENLIANNHAYVSEGHVYFDVTSAKDYGCLSGRNLDEMISEAKAKRDLTGVFRIFMQDWNEFTDPYNQENDYWPCRDRAMEALGG